MKIGINGLGRIGRAVLKISIEKGVDVVAVNDLTDIETLVYLIKYDSVYGVYGKEVKAGKDFIEIEGKRIKVFSEPDPKKLPWGKLNVDVVIESTGIFKEHEKASLHIKAGANKVIVSAPSKNPDITVVLGVNDDKLRKSHKVISMASCTTNCLAPVVKVLDDNFGVKKGFMTTVHAYTGGQGIVDSPNKKLRRGRAGAANIIPTTSGATSAVAEVIPKMKGKLDGLALRVPVICGSITDFVCELDKKVSIKEVNAALKKSAENELKGILEYTEDEIVSSDIIANHHTSIVDGLSTQVIGNSVKVLSWYDNEFGYSNKLVDLVMML